MSKRETLIKKYGNKAIESVCKELEKKGKHVDIKEFEKLCEKYADK